MIDMIDMIVNTALELQFGCKNSRESTYFPNPLIKSVEKCISVEID